MGGVDEDDCFAGVESVPDGGEGRVAKVFWWGGAVGGEEDDAVGLKGVEGVGDFGEDRGGVFGEVGDAGEEAEAFGVGGAEVGAEVVAGSG